MQVFSRGLTPTKVTGPDPNKHQQTTTQQNILQGSNYSSSQDVFIELFIYINILRCLRVLL